MKKTYQKPMVNIERFELSQHIAACDNKVVMNQAIKDGCSGSGTTDSSDEITTPMENIFIQSTEVTSQCKIEVEDICYASISQSSSFYFGS